MNERDSYKTIKKPVFGEIKVQKSKFISNAFPLDSQLKFQEILDNVRKQYYDAAHHPFAYRLGLTEDNFRYSDDGEPNGSAGKPILDAIDKYELTNVMIVTARYFGGVKLGVGGLRRAFFDSAEECLKGADIVSRFIVENFILESDYNQLNVIMNTLEREGVKVIDNQSGEKVKLNCSIRKSKFDKLKSELVDSTSGNIIIKAE